MAVVDVCEEVQRMYELLAVVDICEEVQRMYELLAVVRLTHHIVLVVFRRHVARNVAVSV